MQVSKPFIVLGDKTTHGGTVISADMTCDINGKFMARWGDKTVCPRCKGIFPITSGASDVVDGSGMAYARHMDGTACGAKLLSSQATTTWSAESSGSGALTSSATESPAQNLSAVVAAQTPTLCLECLVSAAARGDGVLARG
jgi:uncharacterized Zn-binding protein involved in type VI secretion